MNKFEEFKSKPWELAHVLASQALTKLEQNTPPYAVAKQAIQTVCVNNGDKVLDISSPQWFTICLAKLFPEVIFEYVNIIESEIVDYRIIAEALELTNLTYSILDIRNSNSDRKYNHIYSISVIEHVYPEVGGDVEAFENISQLLKPEGRFILTVPYKENFNVVFQEGGVYERSGKEKQFFCREYDQRTYNLLESRTGFTASSKHFITEKRGLFSMDYHEWGPGAGKFMSKIVLFAAKVVRRIISYKFDVWVSKRYYNIAESEEYRLINIIAVYDKCNLKDKGYSSKDSNNASDL
jgi:SAM-dependent methyltransferase